MKHFYAHGKLLLTAEYLVLDGAKALAVPTSRGQHMRVKTSFDNYLHWKSLDEKGQVWFQGIWNPKQSSWQEISHPHLTTYLEKIFRYVQEVLGKNLTGISIETCLEFDRAWGLGSSSTLVSLLAQWLQIDAYNLLKQSFGGSGYDIACATAESPITYQIAAKSREIKEVDFNPIFQDNLSFLYLGQKQNSREGIQYYRSLQADKSIWIQKINLLTEQILSCTTLIEMEQLLAEHESILSEILSIQAIKERLFPDYPGSIKSLGAWGGDFAWVTHRERFDIVKAYFSDRGYPILIPYREMIYHKIPEC